MSRKLYDLAVKTGQWTTPSGENKGVWQNVGGVFEGTNGGQFILLARWFSPAGVPDFSGKGGGDSVILSCFEPRQDGQRPQPQAQPQPQQKPAARSVARSAPQPVAAQDEDVPF